MAKKNSLKTAPYRTGLRYVGQDSDGNEVREPYRELAEYAAQYPYHDSQITWETNEPFTATMRLVTFQRGRSAARFVWEDQNGTKYPMFMSGMEDLVKNSVIEHGEVHESRWIVVRRGENYGIERYED